jgi:hypothetical protein
MAAGGAPDVGVGIKAEDCCFGSGEANWSGYARGKLEFRFQPNGRWSSLGSLCEVSRIGASWLRKYLQRCLLY